MKNFIIIDGYNLLFACPAVFEEITRPWPGRKNMEAARNEMLTLFARYQRLVKEEITVVFDSRLRGINRSSARVAKGKTTADSGRAGLKILFAKSGDAEIIRLVDQSQNPKGLRVITSDAALRKEVKSLGAQVSSARPFLEEVDKALSREMRKAQKEPPEKFHGPNSFEVDYWLKIFKGEEDDA